MGWKKGNRYLATTYAIIKNAEEHPLADEQVCVYKGCETIVNISDENTMRWFGCYPICVSCWVEKMGRELNPKKTVDKGFLGECR